jgi:uncharacterized integral membrane protein
MAEIPVVKRRSRTWLWVLMLVLLVLVALWFLFVMGSSQQAPVSFWFDGGQPFAAAPSSV